MGDEPHNPYAPPAVAQVDRMVAREAESISPKGIGGWLVVSLSGVILVGLMCLSGLVRVAVELDEWLALLHLPEVALQFAGTLLLFSAVLGLAVLGIAWMIRHDRRLPRAMIAFYALQSIMWVMIIFTSDDPERGTDAYEAGRAIGEWLWPGRCVLWIWYYLSSERVKNTFVK